MRKLSILKIVILAIVLYAIYDVLFPQSTTNLGSGYSYVDGGYGFEQYIFKNTKLIVPEKVVMVDTDSNLIIATRIVIKTYKCCNKDISNCMDSNVSIDVPIYMNKLEYWIINKKNGVVYILSNKSQANKKLQQLKSLLKFNENRYLHNTAMNMLTEDLPNNQVCIQNNIGMMPEYPQE